MQIQRVVTDLVSIVQVELRRISLLMSSVGVREGIVEQPNIDESPQTRLTTGRRGQGVMFNRGWGGRSFEVDG